MADEQDPLDVFRAAMGEDDPPGPPMPGIVPILVPKGHPLAQAALHAMASGVPMSAPLPPGGAAPINFVTLAEAAGDALRGIVWESRGEIDPGMAGGLLSLADAMDALPPCWLGSTIAQALCVYLADLEPSFDAALGPWMRCLHGEMSGIAAYLRATAEGEARRIEAEEAARPGWLARAWRWLSGRS